MPAAQPLRSAARRLPVGAEILDEEVDFRVWAPDRSGVAVVLERPGEGSGVPSTRFEHPLAPENLDRDSDISDAPDRGPSAGASADAGPGARSGYFSGRFPAVPGDRYWFRLDDEESLYPDPASRFQPEGPHGPSEIVDPSTYAWSDGSWRGLKPAGQVLYEMHVGTFTAEGTFAAAAEQLPALSDLGVTAVEVMPVADFPGDYGWGYDGVNLFAPSRLYGRPGDLRAFVDRAHGLGLGVILDVVYNHVGPDGNFLPLFSSAYFTDRYHTPWGEAINFDGESSRPVREFFIANAGYWIEEFHLDGLRLDAVHAIHDCSEEHVVVELTRRSRERAGERSILIFLENEDQEAGFARRAERGEGAVDGLWNDDFHHTAKVALSDRGGAYYTDFRGSPQELISAVKFGYLFQGQPYVHTHGRRGTVSLDLPPMTFVNYLDNHDQVANAGGGRRAHMLSDPGTLRTLTAFLLLGPGTPMLFQGQEFAASSPFFFFADHHGELAPLVREGRAGFMTMFPPFSGVDGASVLPHPDDREAFEASRLRPEERQGHENFVLLHRDLLGLRRDDPVIRLQGELGLDGAVLTDDAFLLRYFGEGEDRLLVINLGRSRPLRPAAEPLLAPMQKTRWSIMWSSESPAYGGLGTPDPITTEGWWLPGRSALLFRPS